MRVRTYTFVTLDGYVSTPDGRPVQLLLPGFPGATAYGLPEFLASCEAVVMGRTTFLPALSAEQWPWRQPVFVLTSSPLPEGTPDHVRTASTASDLLEVMGASGVTGDCTAFALPMSARAHGSGGCPGDISLTLAWTRDCSFRDRIGEAARVRARPGALAVGARVDRV